MTEPPERPQTEDTGKLEPLGEGRYELLEVIGTGGMATVYRAYDHRLQTARAIKLLAPELTRNSSVRRRFEVEARTMASIHHPNIVGVHDVGAEGERFYIVMEYVPAGSLMEFVQENGPMPPRLAVEALLPILSALEEAHAQGIIHRDIKPHNILVTANGQPRITDFGIAHVANEDMNLTKTGSVMGTWGFMAPEQRVSARQVDGRADIYAFGATLYTLLTGEVPVDLFACEIDGEMLRGVPESLRPVIQKATCYKPEERYADCDAVRRDLRALLDVLPTTHDAYPTLGLTEEQKKQRRESGTIVPASTQPDSRASGATFAGDLFEKVGQDGWTLSDERSVYYEGGKRKGPRGQLGSLFVVLGVAIGVAAVALWPGEPEPVSQESPVEEETVPEGAEEAEVPQPELVLLEEESETVPEPTPEPTPVVEPVAQPAPVPEVRDEPESTDGTDSRLAPRLFSRSGRRGGAPRFGGPGGPDVAEEGEPYRSEARVEGQVTEIIFNSLSDPGHIYRAGQSLPEGSYLVRYRYDEGTPLQDAGTLEIAEGSEEFVRCVARMQKCGIR